MGVLAVAAVVLSYWAVQQTLALQEANTVTEEKTRAAEASALAAESREIFAQFPRIGLLLAVQAMNNLRPDDTRVPEVEETLRRELSNSGGEELHVLDGR